MEYNVFKKLKLNKQGFLPCVVIRTGEEGKIININHKGDGLLIKYKKHGFLGFQEEWFNYTEIATW